MMQCQMKKSNFCAAEDKCSASYNASASDAYTATTLTAIIAMMAVVLFGVIRHLVIPAILISIICGLAILVIVRGRSEG